LNAAGKTSPIFSFGTNIRYFMQSKGDAITGGASVSVSCTGFIGYLFQNQDINSRAGNFIATYFF
jgi:hypothetical protein